MSPSTPIPRIPAAGDQVRVPGHNRRLRIARVTGWGVVPSRDRDQVGAWGPPGGIGPLRRRWAYLATGAQYSRMKRGGLPWHAELVVPVDELVKDLGSRRWKWVGQAELELEAGN